MTASIDQPGVGVAVLIKRGGTLLLTRRHNQPEQNSWQCAGGYLNAGETVFECAQRCALDTGIQISQLCAGPYTNNIFEASGVHSISLYVLAQSNAGEPGAGWQWYNWQQLPQPLFLPLRLLKDQYSGWLGQAMASVELD